MHLSLRGQQVPDERDRPRLGHREDEHLARLEPSHRRMDHEVVVLPAADGPRRTRRTRAGNDLDEIGLDASAPPARLVDGRRPELRQLRIERVHNSPTTCGVTR